MDIHKNAATTPRGRYEIVRRARHGERPAGIARALGVSAKTVTKWLDRYAAEGEAGLRDRRSRPHRLHRPTPPATAERALALRRQRRTLAEIARKVGVSKSTAARLCRRAGLARLKALDPVRPVVRYEREKPGELLHMDIKKLSRIDGIGHRITGDRRGQSSKRGTGWEFAHVCIDDHSRLAYVEVLPCETKASCTAFLLRAVDWFASLGVRAERLMTDNGPAYRSKIFGEAVRALGVRHVFTKPYTPQTNGKAERFIQTALREWAYARPYSRSTQRTRLLGPWLDRYNRKRPHASLDGNPPASRIPGNNLLALHI